MQVKTIIFPNDDGFNVLIWGKWTAGSMRVQHFDNRTVMAALLKTLRLISSADALVLEHFDFIDSCPLFSAEIDEETLVAYGFERAD